MTTIAQTFTAPLFSAVRVLPKITNALALYRQRQALTTLSDEALCDIGICRATALAEAKRPIWDVPAGWRA